MRGVSWVQRQVRVSACGSHGRFGFCGFAFNDLDCSGGCGSCRRNRLQSLSSSAEVDLPFQVCVCRVRRGFLFLRLPSRVSMLRLRCSSFRGSGCCGWGRQRLLPGTDKSGPLQGQTLPTLGQPVWTGSVSFVGPIGSRRVQVPPNVGIGIPMGSMEGSCKTLLCLDWWLGNAVKA